MFISTNLQNHVVATIQLRLPSTFQESERFNTRLLFHVANARCLALGSVLNLVASTAIDIYTLILFMSFVGIMLGFDYSSVDMVRFILVTLSLEMSSKQCPTSGICFMEDAVLDTLNSISKSQETLWLILSLLIEALVQHAHST